MACEGGLRGVDVVEGEAETDGSTPSSIAARQYGE